MITNKKGALGETIVIGMAIIPIIIIILYSVNVIFGNLGKDNAFTVKDAESEIGDNLFVVGLLRSQLKFGDNTISLSEMISRYNLASPGNDLKYYTEIQAEIQKHVNVMLKQMFSKDVCWKMALSNGKSIGCGIQNCAELSKEEDITATVVVAGFDEKSFEVRFETKK